MMQTLLLVIVAVLSLPYDVAAQVTLTCGGEEHGMGRDRQSISGSPGKKGPTGERGIQGSKGSKGEPGESNTWREEFQRLEQRYNDLERQLLLVIDEKIQQNTRKDCQDHLNRGISNSGVKSIDVDGKILNVYCDMDTTSGGWLVIQYRFDGSENFYRPWSEYQKGFGNTTGEFWLGLDNLHAITSKQSYRLRIEIEDFENNRAIAEYGSFAVGAESLNYRLSAGSYSGSAGDSLKLGGHIGRDFSTFDMDHDRSNALNCAQRYSGAWWYNSCHQANLNGQYYTGGRLTTSGVTWYDWKGQHYSLKRIQMKIKPN